MTLFRSVIKSLRYVKVSLKWYGDSALLLGFVFHLLICDNGVFRWHLLVIHETQFTPHTPQKKKFSFDTKFTLPPQAVWNRNSHPFLSRLPGALVTACVISAWPFFTTSDLLLFLPPSISFFIHRLVLLTTDWQSCELTPLSGWQPELAH